MKISDEIIFELKERGFIREDLVKPDYRGFCISNIGPTISEFLGIKFEEGMSLQEMKIIKNAMKNRGISDHYDNIVLLFIDSINDGILNHLIDNSHLGKRKMIRGMLTSTFPSVTPTCLASMVSGKPPISHGVVGFNFLIKGEIADVFELRSVINGKKLSGADHYLKDVFDTDSIFDLCGEEEINTKMILPHQIAERETTKMIAKGMTIEGYRDLDEMSLILKKNVEDGLTYVYIPIFDEIIHKFGTSDDKIYEISLNLADKFRSIFKVKEEKTLLFIVSDHYQIDLNYKKEVRLDDEELTKNFVYPPGISGGRVAYLYTDEAEEVKRELSKYDNITPLMAKEALEEGLFGDGEEKKEFKERIGDVIVIAKGDAHLYYPYKKVVENKASHGALNSEEMMVPFSLIEL